MEGYSPCGRALRFTRLAPLLLNLPQARKLTDETESGGLNRSPLPQQRAASQDISGIQPPLYGAHLLDIRGAVLQLE